MQDEIAIAQHLLANHDFLSRKSGGRRQIPKLADFYEMAKEQKIPKEYVERYLSTKNKEGKEAKKMFQ